MKLAKLSLAAIMTVGALSTANAQPLEEAIKGVDFSGMVRYNLNSVTNDLTDVHSSTNDFDVLGKLVAPVTSNIKATVAFATGGSADSISDDSNNATGGPATLNFDIRKAFFTYAQSGVTVKAGLMPIGTPVTDNGFNGHKGDGVLAMYNAGAVTFAGAYFMNTNFSIEDGVTAGSAGNVAAKKNDVAAAAIIGAMGPVSAQAWFIQIPGVVDTMVYGQVDAKFAGASLTALAISTKLDADLNTETGKFYAVKAGYAIDNFALNAGYTKNDKDQGIYTVGSDVLPVYAGWRLGYEIDNVEDAKAMYVDGSVSFGKAAVKVGYAQADVDAVTKEYKEVYGQVSYKYAKNLTGYVKYSDMKEDKSDTVDQKYFRFEAKYTF